MLQHYYSGSMVCGYSAGIDLILENKMHRRFFIALMLAPGVCGAFAPADAQERIGRAAVVRNDVSQIAPASSGSAPAMKFFATKPFAPPPTATPNSCFATTPICRSARIDAEAGPRGIFRRNQRRRYRGKTNFRRVSFHHRAFEQGILQDRHAARDHRRARNDA